MQEIDPGHQYELFKLDSTDEESQLLTFVKREGAGYPGNVGHHQGTTCQSVLRAVCARVRYLNDQIPCGENDVILAHLRCVLVAFETRAMRRHHIHRIITKDQAEFGPMCPQCGHVMCKHNRQTTDEKK